MDVVIIDGIIHILNNPPQDVPDRSLPKDREVGPSLSSRPTEKEVREWYEYYYGDKTKVGEKDKASTSEKADKKKKKRLRPEAKYYGSGKHGLLWEKGAEIAKRTGKPQSRWMSIIDLEYATTIANAMLPYPGNYGTFGLPAFNSIVYMPDGTIVPATTMWLRHNENGITWHGYPKQ